MAHNWKQPYQPLSTNHSNSPASPYSGGDTPIAFRTNVNRAKTKRWVEAKQYSYDGNDWGDDDEEEEEDDIPPLPSHSNNVNHAQSRDQAIPGHDGTGHGQSPGRPGDTSPTTPIVRPVDIYKRMREGPAGSAESSSADVGLSATGPRSSTNLPPGPGASGDDPTRLHPQDPATGPSPTPLQSQTTPILGLPDVKRLSGFGSDFMSKPAPAPAPVPPPAPAPKNRSRARCTIIPRWDFAPSFIKRSTTSAISPIMPPRTTSDTRTPTIAEEPGEGLSTPTEPVPGFKPGHRRDLSVPSPGNSPSRMPMITTTDTPAQPAAAEMTPSTPFGSPLDPAAPQHPAIVESTSSPLAEKDRPAPLNIGSVATNQHNSTPEVPIIVPSSSTETSPQDARNDRLHQEIIQSLSRENTPSDDPQSRPQTGRPDNQPDHQLDSPPDSLIPSEYERYWTEGLPTSPEDSRPTDSGAAPVPPAPSGAPEESRPRLARRFSWESTSSGEEAPPAVDSPPAVDALSPPIGPMPGQFPAGPADDSPPPPAAAATPPPTEAEEQRPPVEKPKLTIIPPSATDASSIGFERPPEMVHPPPADAGPVDAEPVADVPPAVSAPTESPSLEPSLLGFRDILNMPRSEDRVRAFHQTRTQFGSIDTGLNRWIQVVVQAHPEHQDVVAQSRKQSTGEPKVVVSRGKFPKLPSLSGPFGAHGDGSPGGSGHARRPSGPILNKQQVEQRGKELLHTAGVLGGRAGQTAKGLFARGRSKLKGNGAEQ
ncbi:hypothetical protein P168DRAFT_314063 [Aspergillus campestris IBT 28561]|uniref:Uncharacterized protein n=1 Tax=Aspergillus campestris (strain IBT 28561) TaxID=1392248 RepID=A0A2I1DDK0_ASPC2|nr:uncharacterized protein P168DRAFT_314063 [Aspergillus campestris IBT 28561]PKY07931.1 hypothetical protein P168DRAFT_314063 [Aspergillus campestris IBT 28561]